MEDSILDLSYLYEVSGNDKKYIFDVVSLFLENVPNQLKKLEQLINEDAEWIVIQKQAHSLKSSVLFVKINGLYDCFYGIELLAKQTTGRDEMKKKLEKILNIYNEALPLLNAELVKCSNEGH